MVDPVGIISLIFIAFVLFVSYDLGRRLTPKGSPGLDRVVQTWMVWVILIHMSMDIPFTIISLTGTVKDSTSFFALQWKEYGKTDTRWLVSDPTIVSQDVIHILVITPLCMLLVHAIHKRQTYRHWLQTIIGTASVYAGFMTFGPEIFSGCPHIVTDNPFNLYVYVVFFNGLFVAMSLLLIHQSWTYMTSQSSSTLDEKRKQK